MGDKRRRKKTLLIGAFMIGLLAVLAVLAPVICPYDPLEQDLYHVLQGPGSEGHLLGTDQLGRDILTRLICLPNVIVTSHQGFLTGEALTNIAATTLENISEFFADGSLDNQILLENSKKLI